MTVSDFIYFCTESSLLAVSIWSLSDERIVWRGQASEIPAYIAGEEIGSFEPPENDVICINIE